MSPHRRSTRTHAIRIAGGVLLAVWGVAGCESSPSGPGEFQLVFQEQPSPASERQLLAPVVVALENADGVPDSSTTTAVTLALGANPGGGTLSGTLTVNAVAGVATFDDLSIDRSGSGYTLVASARGLTDVESAPFDVAGASALAVGFSHACVVRSGGQAYCWGYNSNGQLGDGTGSNRTTPVPVGGDIAFASLAPGAYSTCGLTATGEAYCWGRNDYGQLGDSTTTQRTGPVPVAGGHVFASISSGFDHGCAVEAVTRDTYCWGYNNAGQIGDGTTRQSLVPTPVLGSSLFGFDAVSAGWAFTCAVTPDGQGYCWGYNNVGQLGDGTTSIRYEPTAMSGAVAFQSIRVTNYNTWFSACGVTPSGDAYCWGTNDHGQLGGGTTGGNSAVPTEVFGGLAFADVSPGADHTCGVTTDGEAYCWGYNGYGQLGSGVTSGTDDANTPSLVTGGHVFSFVGSGTNFSCGITTDDEVYCWGRNHVGQLGDGTTTDSNVPVLVSGLPVGLGG
jgi:alpha-tubulin suppressor-like RCC1 family protein